MLTTTSSYDDALQRLHRTGPEFDGFLSNHGPMVIESLARWGHEDAIDGWTDRYLRRLDELPRSTRPIDPSAWQDALGQRHLSGDWIAFFRRELAEQPWRPLLAVWWARLVPGIAAGATHGVIRLGHAVAALDALETEPRLEELAHALGYWATRWQPMPLIAPGGRRGAAAVIVDLPRVADQTGGALARLAQLGTTAGWAADVATLRGPDTVAHVPDSLAAIIDAVVPAYRRYGHQSPTMLVHAATAPNAVLRTLPLLPRELWATSLAAAWSATAALVSAYAPAAPATVSVQAVSEAPSERIVEPGRVVEAALRHGSEHVIKFADTALASHARSGDPAALSAALTAVRLDA